MIPYDDLVIALQTWRAKQGLSVGQLSGSLTPPPPPPAHAGPPPTRGARRTAPPPMAGRDSALEVDDSLLADDGSAFGGYGEATAISQPPQRPSDPFGGHTVPDFGDQHDSSPPPPPPPPSRKRNR